MNQQLIIPVLAIIIILAALSTYLFLRLRKLQNNLNKSIKKAVQPYTDKIRDLEAELKRVNFLLSQCKNEEKNEDSIYLENNTQIDLKKLLAEKQRLEQERESLKEKTKKLWEQSLAIHKEKERIDRLRKEIESRHKEITDSITYASRIQTALLPKEEQIAQIFKDFFVLWKPKQIVSGDFYWIKKYDNRIFVVAADCTGHGVPGAFMSLLGISFLNEIINSNPAIEAHMVLEQLREYVTQALGEEQEGGSPKDGMDLALVIIDSDKNTMQYSGANNPVYVIRNNELVELKPVRAPIGYYLVHREFKKQDFNLQPNDTIYMFSDGFTDQFGDNPRRSKFTRRRFKELLLRVNQMDISMQEQKEIIWNVFEQWKGSVRQVDDVMLLGIRW